jgi:hypothetical protein
MRFTPEKQAPSISFPGAFSGSIHHINCSLLIDSSVLLLVTHASVCLGDWTCTCKCMSTRRGRLSLGKLDVDKRTSLLVYLLLAQTIILSAISSQTHDPYPPSSISRKIWRESVRPSRRLRPKPPNPRSVPVCCY